MTRSWVVSAARARGPAAPSGRGFTLIELLVVIAILAILASILLPSLSAARETTRRVACASNLRQLAIGVGSYATENREVMAGPNTSGADGQATGGSIYLGDTTGETPTTTHDWLSPTMGIGLGFSPNRAERTGQIFDRFACPAAKARNDQLFGGAGDRADFERLFETRGYAQVSYLAPAAFHYFASGPEANRPANRYRGVTLKYSHATPVAVEAGYRPRLDRVGVQASDKVIVSDGTRYLDSVGGLRLDFDVHPDPEIYGSFTESGPTFHGSTAFGRSGPGGPTANVQLSFRHGGAINAAYFDGHVGSMGATQAWTDARPWYPGGSRFNGSNGTPESRAFHKIGEVLP